MIIGRKFLCPYLAWHHETSAGIGDHILQNSIAYDVLWSSILLIKQDIIGHVDKTDMNHFD